MTLGLSTDPEYPEAGEEVALTLTDTAGDPAFARWELASVPQKSLLSTGMLVDGNGAYLQTFTPDVPGIYEVVGYDVRAYRGTPQFAGDVNGGARQRVLAKTIRQSVYCIAPMDLRISTIPGHGITLRLGIVSTIVYSASLVDWSTDLARQASLDNAVIAAIADLEGLSISLIVPTLTSRVAELSAAFTAHIAEGATIHLAADAVNVPLYDAPYSDESALAALNSLYDLMMLHVTTGTTGTWHTEGDTKNAPITAKPSTKAQAHVVASDLERRVYSRHLAQTSSPTAHGSADATNVLSSATELTTAIVSYLDYIAANTTDANDNEHTGAIHLERRVGMMPAPDPDLGILETAAASIVEPE